MRSKLGTKSRLAAHITALVLLIVMLVYYSVPPIPAPPPEMIPPRSSAPVAPPVAAKAPVAPVTPPVEPPPAPAAVPAAPAPEIKAAPPAAASPAAPVTPAVEPAVQPAPAKPVKEEEKAGPAPAPPEPVSEPVPVPESGEKAPAAATPPETPKSGAVQPEAPAPSAPESPAPSTPPASTAEAAAPETNIAVSPASEPAPGAPAEVQSPAPQPDESGSLVVAEPDNGAAGRAAVLSPLGHANLEVLGDGIYWLAPGHDLQREMAAVPEVKTLVLLAPLPGYRAEGFEHVKTEVIPADPGDLNEDAAARFLNLTSGKDAPVVVAALPGAGGAAFFKGLYLMARRDLQPGETLKEIEPELEAAGSARDEIVHRLNRLDLTALK